MSHYNLDGIQVHIRKDIAATQSKIKAWESVTFPTKKDGSPFEVLSKNINGATIHCESWAMQAGENKLQVNIWCPENGYIQDEIYCYELVPDLKDENKIAKTENYQPKQSYLKQVYTYDLDDIKQAINDRIAYLKKWLADQQDDLENVATAYNNFKMIYGAAVAELEKAVHHASYDIRETVTSRYPYC